MTTICNWDTPCTQNLPQWSTLSWIENQNDVNFNVYYKSSRYKLSYNLQFALWNRFTQWLRVHTWDFLDSAQWFQPPGYVFWVWGYTCGNSPGPHSDFNLLATSSGYQGTQSTHSCTVDPFFGNLLSTVDPTLLTCPILVQGNMCCAVCRGPDLVLGATVYFRDALSLVLVGLGRYPLA